MRTKIGVVVSVAILTIGLSKGLVAQSTSSSGNEVYSPNLFSGLSYRMIGPSRGGRVTAVAGHRAQPSTFYMGATGGGV